MIDHQLLPTPFPVLQGDRLIGRLDAKRDGKTLAVRAYWPELGVKMGKARIAGIVAELGRLRHLAATDTIELAKVWLKV